MTSLLKTIAPSDDFLWDVMCAHLPKFRRSATEFNNFNCPICSDYKPRCGIKRSSHIGINCFAAGTMVITNHGTLPIETLVGKDDVEIVDGDGNWTPTVFNNYGLQRLYRLEMTRNQRKKIIYTTAGHRWILRRGGVLTTDQLRAGHSLKGMTFAAQERKIVNNGVRHGFVFGDGSRSSKNFTSANFCTEDKKALLPFFEGYPVSEYPKMTRVRRCDPSYKTLPLLSEDSDYIFSFLAGLFAADGSVSPKSPSSATISCKDVAVLMSLRDLFAKVGISTYEPREMPGDAPGRYKNSPIWQMTLVRSSIPAHFYLNPKHSANVSNNKGVSYDRLGWKVVSVEKLDKFEDVYCCEVSTTQSFLLADNLLTSNCYNCGFAARYKVGGHLSNKMKEFLSALRIDDLEIKRINLKSLAIRRLMSSSDSPEIRALAFEPSFDTMELPLGAAPLMQWVEQGCTEPLLLQAAEYAMSRGDVVFEKANFHWTPTEGFENRVIIPFMWRGRIVGYTARAFDDDKDKYKNFMQMNFLFNATPALENYEREYAILVEGPTDALAIDGVSPLGSRLNEKQTVWLKNSGKRIIVVPDRDEKGQKMIDIARKNNWMVSFPHIKSNSRTWWDSDIKDCDEAVKRHGRLYTLKSILECATNNGTEIEVKRKYLL